ncbi:hypothetical protein PHMEG_00026089 [Phytophthora megakarya]|uniref:Uncharacterized protein n=1 Tax=Phytophthora megakarya TaxID=4795 RepID=A0A225VCZ5_9STRA|nr:hypothetical protein PHMEG_00026089 [Phytophthora megakarya]
MGRWLDQAKVYYCKLKLSSAVRDWRGNVEESEERNPPREFYYELNKIAGKADIDIKSTDVERERHLKVFIKKLKDTQLRSTLQGQRVRSLKDLEHILKQHEEIRWSDDREAHPLKNHDLKSDSAFGNRQRQKLNNRAYNVNEDDAFASDDERQVLLDQGVEGAHQKVSFGESTSDRDVDGLSGDIPDGNMILQNQDATSEVSRILESSGWRPPNSEYRSPPKTDFGKSQQTLHCDNCSEGSHSTEFCGQIWNATDATRRDTPLNIARLILTLQALKNLGTQGSLNDVPEHLLNQLLDGHVDSGTKPLNH